jgi:hypothetical protein
MIRIFTSLILIAAVAPLVAAPQNQASVALEQQLITQYRLTPVDRAGQIGPAGSVVVLQKAGLVMYTVANPMAPQSTYKNGKISKAAFSGFGKDFLNAMNKPGASAAIDQRVVAAGENAYVTRINIEKDGAVFRLYDGAGYYGELKFPFAKNAVPAADEILPEIQGVLSVLQEATPAATPAPAPAAESVPQPAPAAEQPPSPPPTLKLGMSIDEIVAAMGQPDRVADLGAKKIYSYKDMKITFVDGKVSDIQ